MRGIRKFRGLLLAAIAATILLFAVMPLATSFAETITYTYDATNQLKQEQYAGGFAVAYDYDGMGNMQAMAASNTDATAPSAPIIASPASGGVVNTSNVTLSGTAEAQSTVKVYNGAVLLGSTTADATGAWTYTTTLMPDGNYSFTATATDVAGNVSGASTLVTVTIQTTAPTTTASPMGGTYNSAQSVTLTCFDGTGSGCDKIYYTTDGSTPTTASSIYTAPIGITSTTTLNYFAVDLSGRSEPVKSQTYAIDTTPPVTTASPAGGSYNTTQSVTLTCDDGSGSGCGKIYYTTDGTMPTTSSNVYSGAISIALTTTLKYFAADLAGNSETVKSETYTLPNCYWTNTSGGNWSTANNWSCGHAPTSADNAFITQNGTYTVTLDANATVNDLVIGGSSGTQALSASSRTLTINSTGAVGNHAVMNLSSSTVSGAGSITNNGAVNLSSSTVSLTGSFTNGSAVNLDSSTLNTALVNGGTVNAYRTSAINGTLTTRAGSLIHVEANSSNNSGTRHSSTLTVANGFTNNGTLEIVAQGGTISVNTTLRVTSGTLVNAAGGVINSLTGSGVGTCNLEAAIDNQGTLAVSYPLTISKTSAVHTNGGTIAMDADLTVSQSGGSFANNGIILLAIGKTLSVSGGTFNQNVGATLGGTGATLSLSGLTANLQTAVGVSTLSLSSVTANLTSDIDLGTMTLNLSSSTVNGPVTITNPAGKTLALTASTLNTALVNGGTVNAYQTSAINGALTVQAGSLLHVEGNSSNNSGTRYSSTLTIANGFTNNGAIEIVAQGGTISVNTTLRVASGTLVNAPGGIISSFTGSGVGTRNLEAALDNQGMLMVSYPLTISKSSAAYTNSGTISVDANLTVSNGSSFTNNGIISIASGKTLSVNGGTFTQNATINGAESTLSLSSLTATMSVPVTLGNLILDSVTTTLPTGNSLGALSLTSSTVTLSESMTTALTTLNLNSSTVNGPVTITNPAGKTLALTASTLNTALVNGGTVNAYKTSAINGALTTQSGSLIHVEGNSANNSGIRYSSVLTVANGFTNNGTIDIVAQGGTISVNTTLRVTSGTLENAPGGIINSLTGAGVGTRNLEAAINNQGTLTVSYPLTISKSSAVHTNSGTISIASGQTLSLSGGTFTNATSGLLSGSGTISCSSATFTNSGTIAPGPSLGKLSITGALPQTAASVVNMEIGGTTVGVDHDQLAVSGAATLNGTLNVSLVNGFTPSTGDSFTMLTYGSKTGSFSAVNLPPMGRIWNTTSNPTSLVLSVGDACPSIALFPASLPTLTVGTAFSQSITATEGVGSYAYSVTSGSLPSGLALSADGVLSGTPDAPGTFTFAVSATDTNYCAGTMEYTITVQTPCVGPLSGLVSWWQAEGDAGDQISRNTGTLQNGPTFTAGKVGQAFSFDGVDDMVQAGTSGLPTGNGDRTMAMWVRIAQPTAMDSAFAGYGATGAGDQLYMLGATGSGNTLFFSNGATPLTGPNLQNGRWYHVAVTNSGSLVTLYLDGAVTAGGTLDLSTPINSPFFIGYLDADRKLNGAVDEVQVFDRALSATEIAAIYHTGGNGLCDTVAPTVLSSNPAQAATNVPITAPIAAVFSEAMDTTTISAASFTVSDGVTGTVTYDAATKTATFAPSAALAYATTYTATITSGVKDPAGNALAADYSWSFTTEPSPDATPPTGSITINSGAASTTGTSVTLTLTCSDAGGCSRMQFSNDNVNWSAAEAYATTKTWTMTSGDGAKTVYARFEDTAGNWSEAYSDTITLSTYDLTVTAVSGPANANITQLIPVAYTIRNQGGSSAASIKVGIYLSADATIGTGDTLIGYDTVASLGAGAQATRSGGVWVPATMAAGTYYIGAIADYDNSVAETDETNNALAGNQTAITAVSPDLTVTTVSAPASANITAPVTVSTTIRNQGGTTGGFYVYLYLSTDAAVTTADTYVGYIWYGNSLSTGAQATVSAAVRVPATMAAGTYYIGAVVDPPVTGYPSGFVTESNETNNTLAGTAITVTSVSPDLAVTTATVPASANASEVIAVSTTIKNQGGNTGAFYVFLYASADAVITSDDTYLGYGIVNSLAAGAQTTMNVYGKVPTTMAGGNYYIGAMVDPPITGYPSGYVAESNEANNALAGNPMTVTTTAPDLTIATVSGPTSANITEPTTVQALIKNQGGSAGGFYVRAYLSADGAISSDDTWAGSLWFGSNLAAGAQTTVNIPVKVPTTMPAGSYFIGAVVDDGNYVAENNETNNALAGNSISVYATSPDLTLTAVSGPATGVKGQPITVSFTTKNQGGTTGDFYTGVYLSTDATITAEDTLIGYGYFSSLAGGASQTRSGSLTIPANLAGGTYYIGAVADLVGTVVESNEANNAMTGNQIGIGP